MNFKTKKYKSRTSIIKTKNGLGEKSNDWVIGVDVGFSTTVIVTDNEFACFPSFARKVTPMELNFIGGKTNETIIYKNLLTNELWLIGEEAIKDLEDDDSNVEIEQVYNTNITHYETDLYKVLAEAGLGIGLLPNSFGMPYKENNEMKEIYVCTGLPEKYAVINGFKEKVKKNFVGHHAFSLEIGGAEHKFEFTVKEENVRIESQPKAGLFASIIKKDLSFTRDAQNILSSKTMTIDPGMLTVDAFNISNGRVQKGSSWEDCSMSSILEKTIEEFNSQYGTSYSVFALQNHLEDGKMTISEGLESYEVDFEDILTKKTNECLDILIEKLKSVNVGKCKYLILTGGLNGLWGKKIKERLSKLTTLTIIDGDRNIYFNINTDSSSVFCVAYGYYVSQRFKSKTEK